MNSFGYDKLSTLVPASAVYAVLSKIESQVMGHPEFEIQLTKPLFGHVSIRK